MVQALHADAGTGGIDVRVFEAALDQAGFP